MVADTKKPTFYLKPPPKGMGELRKDVKDYTKTQRKGLRTSGDSFTGKGCTVCSLSNNGGVGNNVSFRTNRRPLAIVGSNITEEEYKSGRLFSGKTGNLIREIMISTLIRSACELPNEWIDQNVAYLKAVRCKGVATVAEAHACWKHLELSLIHI